MLRNVLPNAKGRARTLTVSLESGWHVSCVFFGGLGKTTRSLLPANHAGSREGSPMRQLALHRKTIIAFGVVLLLQLFLSVMAYRHVVALMEINSRVAHAEEVLATLESLLAQAQDVEVERGFLLT